jgi:PAS domain S-box-containing protein
MRMSEKGASKTLPLVITDRKQAEQLYRTLATSSPVGVYIAQEGKFVFINPQFQKYTGFTEDELLGRDSLSLVHPEDREVVRENAIEMLKGKRSSPYEFRVIDKGGETIWAIETVTSIHYKGERAALGNFMDVTERKRMEAKLEQKTIELEQVNIRLQEMDRLKSIFLASMSHELRTPLNSIIGFTSLILEGMVGEINEEQRIQLTLVKCSADHLLSLINDVLDISKIEAGKVEFSLEEFRLNDVIEEVVESFSPIANLKSTEIFEEMPKGITLFSDRRRVKQVLMNLISNAVKFTEQGSVKIVGRVLRDDILEISVIDTGIGIRKEDMNRLFMPFQQVDTSLTKKHEGTGLGLHLTKKIVTLLGGNISAKSEYGKGSEFTFTIPLQYVEVQKNEKSASSRGQ